MYSTLFVLALATLSFDMISAGGAQAEPAPVQNILFYAVYDQCEGKDTANYTLLGEFTENYACDYNSIENEQNQLIQCQSNGQKAVVSLQLLARSLYPAGAYIQSERLFLATGGPLQGKYLYEKEIHLELAYLKKCSSVLGYSYATSKSATLLINDKLDLNVLISPTGGFEVFKKGCTTICNGRGYFL